MKLNINLKKNQVIQLIKNVKKIAFLFLLIAILWPVSAKALSDKYEDKLSELLNVEKEEGKVNIYFFHGQECPHCASEIEFLKLLETRYEGKYNIYYYETWHNQENKELMLQAKKIMGDTASAAVPYTVIGEVSFIGYSESVGEKIELNLKNYLEIISEEEYLVNKASDNGIYLRYENVKEMFNNILKYYIKMFKLRKENELLKKEYEKRLNELLIHLKEEELKRKEEREYFLHQLEQERKIREEEKKRYEQ